MSYAQPNDVLARSGPLLGPFSNTSVPTLDGVQGFLDTYSALVDATLGGMGIPVPLTGDVAEAFRGMVADSALALSLLARYPGAAGASDAAGEALSAAQARAMDAWRQLADGSFPALGVLRETGAAAQPSALATDEPLYGIWPALPGVELGALFAPHGGVIGSADMMGVTSFGTSGGRYRWANHHLDPAITRGMKL